ncbi:hypothetical protein [Lyngbya confervoides]|uniref:Uncharacterized protein n=1 Tax=Lyngbya confervoides BDU141951 TaxID=1574623 RepID=A0ABD4T1C4_9CYAN|nr:hypothetical protein [Lyngbya confervoides]MCM1982443.1 hypothetical protein [Lyngbya confervoides BDU141951]
MGPLGLVLCPPQKLLAIKHCSECCSLRRSVIPQAIREGIQNDSTRFNQIFVELVKKRGILFEPELMQQYGGAIALVKQAKLGAQLALRGKLSPFPSQIKNADTFRQALDKASKP